MRKATRWSRTTARCRETLRTAAWRIWSANIPRGCARACCCTTTAARTKDANWRVAVIASPNPACATRCTRRREPLLLPGSKGHDLAVDRAAAGRRGACRCAGPDVVGPAHLGDRPLQFPLSLLHARGAVRARPRFPARTRALVLRRDRAPGAGLRRPRRAQAAADRR